MKEVAAAMREGITPAEAEILQQQVQRYGPIPDDSLPDVLAAIRLYLRAQKEKP